MKNVALEKNEAKDTISSIYHQLEHYGLCSINWDEKGAARISFQKSVERFTS